MLKLAGVLQLLRSLQVFLIFEQSQLIESTPNASLAFLQIDSGSLNELLASEVQTPFAYLHLHLELIFSFNKLFKKLNFFFLGYILFQSFAHLF